MSKKLVAMILAGGKGTRLHSLTRKVAKPAVAFGAKYRIIDFPLSNCANSSITTVGVLTQYESVALDEYIGNGEKWGLDGVKSLTTTLSPRQTEEGLNWYKGTADAIYENIEFLDNAKADYVLILSGDHIYSTTYTNMFKQHLDNNADCTIAVYEVPIEEASRFGILVADENNNIIKFVEKPKKPISNLASMGIYIFSYDVLRKALIKDAKNTESSHDFGNDIIPMLLGENKKLMAYTYKGYWKDVGTVASLHQANIDLLLNNDNGLDLYKILNGNKIYTSDSPCKPQYIGPNAKIKNSLINQGTVIEGSVDKCVISNEVVVEKDAYLFNSVILTGAYIGRNAKVYNAVVAPNSVVLANEVVGSPDSEIVLYDSKRRN